MSIDGQFPEKKQTTFLDELTGEERAKLVRSVGIVAENVVHHADTCNAIIDILDLMAAEVQLALHVTKLHLPPDQAARMDECTRAAWTAIDRCKEQLTEGSALLDLSEQLKPKE